MEIPQNKKYASNKRKPRVRGRGGSSKNIPRKYVTHQEITGHRLSVPVNPPDVALQPWVPLTLVHSGQDDNSGLYEYRGTDVIKEIIEQLDPTKRSFLAKGAVLQIKLHSVKAWNLGGQYVAMTVFDYLSQEASDGTTKQLCGIMDAGSKGTNACVGYELPFAHRSYVIRTDDTVQKRRLYAVSIKKGDPVLIYVRVEWKFDGPTLAPSSSVDIIQKLYRSAIRVNYQLDTANTRLQDIVDAQPSLLRTLSEKAAEVAIVAADDQQREIFSSLATLLNSMRLLADDKRTELHKSKPNADAFPATRTNSVNSDEFENIVNN